LLESCLDKISAYISHSMNFSLQKDRVFVLRRDHHGPDNYGYHPWYYIVEYQIGQLQPLTWIHVALHRCNPFERPPIRLFKLTLHSCEGFVMIFAELPDKGPYSNSIGWLYDLTTFRWRDLPKPPQRPLNPFHDLMNKIRCNIHP